MSVKSSCLVNSAGDVWVMVVQEAAIAVGNLGHDSFREGLI